MGFSFKEARDAREMKLKTTRKELRLQRGIIRPVLEVAASRDQKTKETEAAAFADDILQDALAAHDLLAELKEAREIIKEQALAPDTTRFSRRERRIYAKAKAFLEKTKDLDDA